MNARNFLSTVVLLLVPVCAQPLAAQGVAPERMPAAVQSVRDQVLADLARQVTERLRLQGDLQLELTRPWSVLDTDQPIDVALLDCPARLTSSLLVQVRLHSAKGPLGDHTLPLRAQLFREAWVARTQIPRDTAFDPSALDTRRVDTLRERDVVPADDVETAYTFTMTVQPGRLITWRDVTRRALVRKGQIVEVSAVDGGLIVTTKAMALENGSAGDTVKLRNLQSRKDFTALVVAEAHAQVRF